MGMPIPRKTIFILKEDPGSVSYLVSQIARRVTRTVSANQRRCCTCIVVSHWLRRFFIDMGWKSDLIVSRWVFIIPPLQRSKGVYWFHLVRLSVRPSVCLSVCGQNRVRSVSSTILVGSISYLHILSRNFRKCVACKVCFKILQFRIFANSLNL